ncbi:MAG: cytidylate kinase family protein [Salinivirgaceae bacterium]|nr:cytidylate kinase family protein [Salinivirgaceae bacterium]
MKPHPKAMLQKLLEECFVKNAFHVLLTVTDEEAAKRIALSKRTDEDFSSSAISKRNQQMKERFIKNYRVDFTNESNYDFIVNTSILSPEEVILKILNETK